MKKIKRWLRDIFEPDNDIDTAAIRDAFNDSSVRNIWLSGCIDELKRINIEVDKRLLLGSEFHFADLCARRKAYQDMLESVLSARRQVTQEVRPNPKAQGDINLDRVTA